MLKYPREVTVAVQGEVEGVLQQYSLLASFTMSESWLNALAWLGFSCEPMGDLLPLGAGSPPKVAFGVAPPIGMLSMGSGKGYCLLGLGDCLGTGVGEMAVVGCSSMGEVLCGNTSGGNGGVCPSRMWYEATSALLNNGGLLYKMTWQVERKLLWLPLSSMIALFL